VPSGVLLAAVAATTAAVAVTAVLPASAATATHAQARAAQAARAKADKIRDSEWWLASMHVPQAWPSSRGSGVTVALLSTGVLTSHPDLTGSVTTGPDYTGSGETSASGTWGIEGTSAASIIAGHGDNTGDASGIIGIAPAARILSVRVAFDAADPLNASATAVGRLPDAIAQGIRYAVAQGAKVIDLPLDPSTLASDGAATGGLPAAAGGSAEERSAVSYAVSKGVVLIAPAGDNGDDGDTSSFPASYPGVIALGAVDRHGALAVFSTRQSYVALTAPGSGVTAASQPSGYRNMSTTDASSAMAAGIAALIRSRYPALTSSQIRQALITGSARSSSASSTGAGAGAGTVDALKAMQAAATIASPPPPSPTVQPSSPAATPAAAAPITAQPRPSTVGMAKSALRDAACAAGGLIVLLLGVLLGLRLWRRRSGQEPESVAEHRTLLDAPSGPGSGPLPVQAASARHARAGEQFAFAPAARPSAAAIGRMEPYAPAAPGPDSVSPRFAPPGMVPAAPGDLDEGADQEPGPGTQPGDPADPAGRGRTRRGGHSSGGNRISGHGLRRTAGRSDASPPGGPPWERAPAPADEQLPGPRSRLTDPFSLVAPPAPVPPPPWDWSGQDPSAPPPASLPPVGPPPVASRPVAPPPLGPPPPGGPELPWRVPGATGADPPAASLSPPGFPAPPTGVPGPPPAVPSWPADPTATPGSGLVSPGGPVPQGGLRGPDPAGGPGQPRPISPRDRLPLEEPGASGPATPLPPPPPPPASPPRPWRIPGTSGRFPGAGDESQGAGSADPGDAGDGYSGRTGRLSRAGEFLPPYAGRPAPDREPEPGPAPAGPPPAAEPAGGWTEKSPSGPLYIWNPAALTQPFPNSPTPPATPGPPPETDDDDPGPHHHRA
jgi:subtilisin family serine protease